MARSVVGAAKWIICWDGRLRKFGDSGGNGRGHWVLVDRLRLGLFKRLVLRSSSMGSVLAALEMGYVCEDADVASDGDGVCFSTARVGPHA